MTAADLTAEPSCQQMVFEAVLDALHVRAPNIGEQTAIAIATSAALRVKKKLEGATDES